MLTTGGLAHATSRQATVLNSRTLERITITGLPSAPTVIAASSTSSASSVVVKVAQPGSSQAVTKSVPSVGPKPM